jgi:conjugative transfer signal peptidase TraF
MRKASLRALGAAGIGLALIGFGAFIAPVPLLVWNASASVPLGLYRLAFGAPERGDFVLVRMPESAGRLAAERGYLPIGIPLVKHVAGFVGDSVCVRNGAVAIDGKTVAYQLQADHAGRSLPRWEGCRRLEAGEYFPLADAPDSFDSRYFGPVTKADLIGRLVPLWIE